MGPAAPSPTLSHLRQTLAGLDPSLGPQLVEDRKSLQFAAPIDQVLGGGLACGALHELAPAVPLHLAAASGFAMALAARASGTRGEVLWIATDFARGEAGAPYGPGLALFGIALSRLLVLRVSRAADVLWAMEEALRCRAVGVVIGEMRSRGIDQVMTRRLALAAAAGDTLGLLLRTTPHDEPSAAATRWIIGATPSSSLRSGGGDKRCHSLGPPRLSARLVRNRRGHLGAWIVEWNSVEQRFELATHSEPLAGTAFDRPHRAAVA